MENFGLLNRVNGMEELPFWKGSCNSIKASEGKAAKSIFIFFRSVHFIETVKRM